MFNWTLLDAILGGDAEVLIGATDGELATEEEETEPTPPDYVATSD